MDDSQHSVLMPRAMLAEMTDHKLSEKQRSWVVWMFWKLSISKSLQVFLNARAFDKMAGSRCRKAVFKYMRESEFWQQWNNGSFEPGRMSRKWEINEKYITPEARDNPDHDISKETLWTLPCDCVPVDSEVIAAVDAFYRKDDVVSLNAAEAMAKVECAEVPESVFPVCPDLKDAHVRAYKRFRDKRGKVRKVGNRVYNAALGLPKKVRAAAVRIDGEVPSTVDVHACWWWAIWSDLILIAKRKRKPISSRVKKFIGFTQTGDFYGTFAAAVGAPYTTDDEKRAFKKRVQTEVMFAKPEYMGKTPLWREMERMFPEVTGYIRWWLSQPRGASRLAIHLSGREAILTTYGVNEQLAAAGVTYVGLHDGVMVPKGWAETTHDWIVGKSKEYCGYACKVKMT